MRKYFESEVVMAGGVLIPLFIYAILGFIAKTTQLECTEEVLIYTAYIMSPILLVCGLGLMRLTIMYIYRNIDI